jgi:cathepsin L
MYGKDKEYKTQQEFNRRLEIFGNNYDRIVKYNRMEDAGFTLEINQFADLEDDEFVAKHASGLVIPEERRRRVEEKHVEPDPELSDDDQVVETQLRRLSSRPAYKNWYKDGFVSSPYDQGACGGCWAFSTASAVESLAKIAGVDKEIQEYSVQ